MSKAESSKSELQVRMFALAFRPFFLVAALASLILVFLWLLVLSDAIELSLYFIPSLWHAHEMIFGFIAAVISGFLLTAVQAWTGLPGIKGVKLILLVLVWFCGRLLITLPAAAHNWSTAALDLAFLPLVAIVLSTYIVRAKQWRNAVFIPILLLYFFANLLMHLQALGIANSAYAGLSLGLWLTLLLIIILGGRVVPMFTSNGLGGVEIYSWKWVNIGSILFFLLFAFADLFRHDSAARYLALICAVFHFVRLCGWRPQLTLKTPLLWVLHIGYVWLIIGFLLYAAAETMLFPRSVAIHAFALGTIGNFVIGMMSRVALGHTGRALMATKTMAIAYALVNFAALLRVIFPVFFELRRMPLMYAAGISWIASFLLFLIVFIPVLSLARLDGKEG